MYNDIKYKFHFQYGVRYDWNSEIQGLILGSYFWGYIVTSIPGGLLAERFGPVRTIGITTILSGALTLLIPLGASFHYAVVIAARFLTGLLGVRRVPNSIFVEVIVFIINRVLFIRRFIA